MTNENDYSYMGCWWKLCRFMLRNKLSEDKRHLFEICKLALTKAEAYENLAADMQELLLDHCANCKDNDTYFCHCKCKWHDYDTDYPFCEEDDNTDDNGRST